MGSIEQDMARQECIKSCYSLIASHHLKYEKRLPVDKELHNILSQIIDRFERASTNGKK